MEQIITNIWNLNALISGILVFILLTVILFLLIVNFIFYPFRRRNDNFDN